MKAATGLQSFKMTGGFRPINQTLKLVEPHRRAPMGVRAPYRPSHRRPPMIASGTPKRMGGFWDDVSITVGLTAGGLGALMLSGVLPSPFKTIAQVGGIGLLAFAAINLMSGQVEGSTTEDVSASYPIGDEADFQAVTAKILSPSRGSETPRGLFSSNYDVQVSWANKSETALAVPFQVWVEEKPEWGIFQEDYRGIAHTGIVTIPAKQVVIVEMQVPLKHRGFGAAMATAINLSLRKISAAGQGFEVANTSFVVY